MCHQLIDPNLCELVQKHTFQGENGNLFNLGWKYSTLLIVDGALGCWLVMGPSIFATLWIWSFTKKNKIK